MFNYNGMNEFNNIPRIIPYEGSNWEVIKRRNEALTWRKMEHSKNKASKNKASKNKASKNKASKKKASKKKASKKKASKKKDSKNKASKNKASKNKASKNKASKNKDSKKKYSKTINLNKEINNKRNSYDITIYIRNKYNYINITGKIQNYIDKNYPRVKNITGNIEAALSDKIIQFVNEDRITSTWAKRGVYQAYTSWKYRWGLNPSSQQYYMEIDLNIYVPYIGKIKQPLFNKWFNAQEVGLKCHEDQHKSLVINQLNGLKAELESLTNSQLEMSWSQVTGKYTSKISNDNDIFDNQTRHGCIFNAGKGPFFNKCKLNCAPPT
jgi:hypothetical protein